MHTPTSKLFIGSRLAVRSITFFNFFIFVLLVVPPAHRWADRMFLVLRSMNLEERVGLSLQFWLPGSTLLATALVIGMIWQNRRAMSTGKPSASIGIEMGLVAVWWVVAIAAGMYAFILGTAG